MADTAVTSQLAATVETYVSCGSRNRQWHLDDEWREMRGPIGSAILHAQWMLDSIAELPTPLRVAEAETHRIAIEAFAAHLRDGLDDLLGDLLGPLHHRARDAGVHLSHYTPDRKEFDAAVSKITNGGK